MNLFYFILTRNYEKGIQLNRTKLNIFYHYFAQFLFYQ